MYKISKFKLGTYTNILLIKPQKSTKVKFIVHIGSLNLYIAEWQYFKLGDSSKNDHA